MSRRQPEAAHVPDAAVAADPAVAPDPEVAPGSSPASVPLATYRLQLHAGFDFRAAAAVVPYLARLGISHLYLSPVLQAAPGSTHGYDVVRPDRLNPELGGEEGWKLLVETAQGAGLGIVLDIVPNHMAITPENPWWWDVLENGRASRYARFFDVEWQPPEPALVDRVLMPILGDHYGRVLEAGEIRLARDGAAFEVQYAEHRLPVAPRSLDGLLAEAARRSHSDELGALADAFAALPPSSADDRESIHRRHRDKEVLKAWFARLLDEQPVVAEAVDAIVAETTADADRLDALLERQNYRLAYWRAAGRDLGYRRFFDVTTLIGLRTEDQQVFWEGHRLVLGLVREGAVSGLRIDHPDGLRDPAEYLDRLREAAPDAWVVVEKILEPGERLRPWPVAGTTGYDFIRRNDAIQVDQAGEEQITRTYATFTGRQTPFAEVARESKVLIMQEILGSELNRVTALALQVCERHRRHRDHTRHDLHEALREIAASFPVYRTYVRPSPAEVAPEDRDALDMAVTDARDRRPDLAPDLFDFLGDVLSNRVTGDLEAELVLRFQQFTGAVMAKGVEDTAYYRFARLLSLNEVGGDPGIFGASVEDFHAENAAAAAAWPETMLCGTTHDTKRSEDARSRISVLSEMPGDWEAALHRWAFMNEGFRTGDAPDRNAEYFLCQTLVGAWPIELERLQVVMQKSMREQKQQTSWTRPDEAYEAAVATFVEGVHGNPEFRADLETFLVPVITAARSSSLAGTLLRLTSPGVPDTYQGAELWDERLVDPDNRRPVDFDRRRALLDQVEALTPEDALARLDEALPKLLVMRRGLEARRRHPEAYGRDGSYRPIEATGEKAAHVVAFLRAETALTVVPRLCFALAGEWGNSALPLPAGRWCDAFTGERWDGDATVPLRALLGRFPVALLEREPES